MKQILGVLMLMGISLSAFPSLAAQAPAARPLTLDKALELAAEQNLDLIAAREGRAIAQAGVITAAQRLNPSFNVNVLRDTPHEGFWFTQPIQLGGKRQRRIEVAERQKGVTEESIRTVALQVRLATRQAYYNLALAQGKVIELQKVVQLARRLLQIAKARYGAGDAAMLEVIQAQLGVEQATANLEVAEKQERVSLSELNELLDEPATHIWNIASPLNEIPKPPLLSGLIEKAYEASPEIASLLRQLDVERSRERLYKAERVPNLDLEYGVDFNSPGQGGFREGPRSQITIGLPLFNRNQGLIAQSLATEDQLDDQIAAARRGVAGMVETNYLQLASQMTKVNLYEQKLVPASQQLESMAEESYRAGKTTILSVITAQQSEQSFEQQFLQSEYAAQAAYAALEAAVGVPLQ